MHRLETDLNTHGSAQCRVQPGGWAHPSPSGTPFNMRTPFRIAGAGRLREIARPSACPGIPIPSAVRYGSQGPQHLLRDGTTVETQVAAHHNPGAGIGVDDGGREQNCHRSRTPGHHAGGRMALAGRGKAGTYSPPALEHQSMAWRRGHLAARGPFIQAPPPGGTATGGGL